MLFFWLAFKLTFNWLKYSKIQYLDYHSGALWFFKLWGLHCLRFVPIGPFANLSGSESQQVAPEKQRVQKLPQKKVLSGMLV